jgi:hypothetical protein
LLLTTPIFLSVKEKEKRWSVLHLFSKLGMEADVVGLLIVAQITRR